MFTDFSLEGWWFAAMDRALEHKFTFNESISFILNCKDQNETSMIVKSQKSMIKTCASSILYHINK